jgi:LysR family glycine cleavage system transcriptional activator
MRRKIPNTAALLAFEAAARHQSFTKAGQELALTQSAICRQIAALEEFLGVPLFSRSKRGVRLTDAGLAYSRQIAARLDEVERDTLDLMAGRSAGGTLEIGTVPTFATRWLIPRLARFQALHPDIVINLATRTRPFLFEGSGLDAAIYFGEAGWPGTQATVLMPEDLVPVCAPALLSNRRLASDQRKSPWNADLGQSFWAEVPLLQMSTRPYAWRQWFAAATITRANDLAGPRFELFSMLAAAAAEGLGIALLPRFLFAEEIAAGRLCVAHDLPLRSPHAYTWIVPEQRSDDPALTAFGRWLAAEAAAFSAT